MVSFSSFWGPADDAYGLLVNESGRRKKLSQLFRRHELRIPKEILRTAIQPILDALGNDPFDMTDLDATITVTYVDHRLTVGDVVTFAGSDALNDLTAAVMNAAHTVATITDEDIFTIEIADPGATDSAIGGAAVTVSRPNPYVVRAETLLNTHTQVTPAQHISDVGPGGVRPIASVDIVNRAVVAADLTDLETVLTEQTVVSTYPTDLSGNGGGGQLGR